MSSYNLIPITDLTATGFTNAVVTTSFTVNSFTVADATGADAQRFIALGPGSPTAPPFTFANDTQAGMWLNPTPTNDVASTSLGFSVQGRTVASLRARVDTNQALIAVGTGALTLVNVTNQFAITDQTTLFTNPACINVKNVRPIHSTSAEFGMWQGQAGTQLFAMSYAPDEIKVRATSGTTNPFVVGSVWMGTTLPGQCFTKPGLLHQATTTITPSTARSNAHVTNLLTGLSTLFVTLPTSVAGLKYTVSNARSVANTVVVNPVVGDTLNVFGLTKTAGASVAANAAFSSITFHCITATQWLATKKTGTWT